MTDTPYDVVEYPSRAFMQCHPDRLATMGRLYGLQSAHVERGRILEVGCGDGINLMGAAVSLPDAEFVGIDLSHAAIERGRTIVAQAGLSNVRLEQLDICAAGEQFGRFDYIIAHGLYSWVPAAIRECLLKLVQGVMNAAGIAFISYNTYPGWYMRRMVREMIMNQRSIESAKEWLETLRREVQGSAAFNAVIADEAAAMLSLNPGYFYHDDLAAVKSAFYFREFVEHASSYGLQYLAEAEPGGNGLVGMSASAANTVMRVAGNNRILQEQYADFLRGRQFRQTLVCHASQSVRPQPDAAAVGDLYAGAPTTRTCDAVGHCRYVSTLGGSITVSDADVSAMLDEVASAWPSFVAIRDLTPDEKLTNAMLDLFERGVVELRTVPPPVARTITARPRTSGLARVRARQGGSVTSLHQIEVTVNNSSLRFLLTLLDGTRTREHLIRELAAMYPAAPIDKVSLAVDTQLVELHRSGLLMDSSADS